MLPTTAKGNDKYHAHETKRISRTLLLTLGGAALLAAVVVCVFLLVGRSQGTYQQVVPPQRPITLSEARRFTNCTEWSGAVDSVKRVAEGQGYLHNFEFDKLHPCCLLANTNPRNSGPTTFAAEPPALTTADVVFIVMTSSKTPLKAKGVLDTWGQGLENLLMISDAADPDLPPGTITPSAAAAKAKANANKAEAAAAAAASASANAGSTDAPAGGDAAAAATAAPATAGSPAGSGGRAASGGSGGAAASAAGSGASAAANNDAGHASASANAGAASGGGGVGASLKQAMDEAHTPIWGVKYLSASPEFAALKARAKWFVLADDDTWVNTPALLEFASRYDPRCPVVFGYVWSKIWSDREQIDYHSGGAGMLMSAEAFAQIAPAFYTAACPFHHYNDITFGRCAWAKGVQLVHSRGFYYDPPERSKDRHETVWLPPVAEAITYHYVHPSDMQLMTQYVNQRWQYTPNPKRTGAGSNGLFLAVSRADLKHTDWEALARKHSNK